MFQSREHIFSLLASLAAGILLAMMMQINASLGQIIGPLESSFVVHLVGTLFASIILIKHLITSSFFQKLRHIPLKLYTCGLYGVVLVLITNIVVPHLGMVLSVSIVITVSLVLSVIADHVGFLQIRTFRVNRLRILGLLCAIGGFFLVLKG